MDHSIDSRLNKISLAEPRDFMGFPFINTEKKAGSSRFDAIYIPTNFNRGRIAQNIDTLKECSERIIILMSEGLSETKRIQCDLHDVKNVHFIETPIVQLYSKKSSENPSIKINDRFDLPEKRNFALIHSRENNYKKILLLDDDIIIKKNDLIYAATLIDDGYPLVGYYVLDYPDVSCVDHILRLKECQPTRVSVGGNCLGINVEQVKGFFPYCYNEDWLFIYGANSHLKTASAGYAMQLPGEPWMDKTRVKFEQFGDVISYGMKKNAITKRDLLAGDLCFWNMVYDAYRSLLKDTLSCGKKNDDLDAIILIAIDALSMFSPSEVVRFIHNYQKEIQDGIK